MGILNFLENGQAPIPLDAANAKQAKNFRLFRDQQNAYYACCEPGGMVDKCTPMAYSS